MSAAAEFGYRVQAECPHTGARRGVLDTPHGPVETPAFMPVGTRGTVKGVHPRELRELGSRMILGNTLHLHLRPGEETVARLGGLHRFMNWDGPVLTDSGGYQVFSMADIRAIDEDGVTFKSVVDGDRVRFTPERVVDIQLALAPDVMMAFDHCPSDPHDRGEVQAATERTHRWLERCVTRWRERGGLATGTALFGIAQGGAFEDLRAASAEAIVQHDLVGYAIGGVSVGEDRAAMRDAVSFASAHLPADKPRYLMGVGTPIDFFDAVERGIDLFDCVTPTRHGRNHQVFTSRGLINLRHRGWKDCADPLDPDCPAPHLDGFSMGVLRHLAKTNEMLGAQLATLHNLHYFHDLLRRIREAICAGSLPRLRDEVLSLADQRVDPPSGVQRS
ncbi:MAG: tRNA guanosine(34) transglycosylase Tgt [Planctomycetota bacterium]|nr:tRNA guanosine(34) transglycosylase Tgt [Planctomycetota bacterium]